MVSDKLQAALIALEQRIALAKTANENNHNEVLAEEIEDLRRCFLIAYRTMVDPMSSKSKTRLRAAMDMASKREFVVGYDPSDANVEIQGEFGMETLGRRMIW